MRLRAYLEEWTCWLQSQSHANKAHTCRKAVKLPLWVLIFQPTHHSETITASVPCCSCCQAHMGCRPPCHRPGGRTGRCWPDTPCTGWSPSRCSVPAGRARRMSPTARSLARRPGKKRRLHPLRWSPWWSRSLPCHWWTACSGMRAKETTVVPSCHCMWALTYACSCLSAWVAYPQLPPKGCYMVTPYKKTVSFVGRQVLSQWVSKESCV